MILAGIDIGTNTIRLLVAETGASSHTELYSGRTITRLGQGLDRTGTLASDARERSLQALQEFAAVIGRYETAATAVVGTSAFRNATNAAGFIAAVKQRTGLDISIITGADEARLTLLGVRRALARGATRDGPLASALVVDIGGGSTELIATRAGLVVSMESLPLGAVYLTERHVRHDPTAFDELDALRRAVRSELEAWAGGALVKAGIALSDIAICAGTAGTVTTLAAMDQGLAKYDPDRINGYVLERDSLDRMVFQLASATLEERRKMPGFEPGREDIILAGAVIVQEIMARCNARQMLVSDWGLREGIVFDLYERMHPQ
jgi:exopolyphosphatase / guanosine-5'-triphosphate,3'-diphosphate pyrophosphatase